MANGHENGQFNTRSPRWHVKREVSVGNILIMVGIILGGFSISATGAYYAASLQYGQERNASDIRKEAEIRALTDKSLSEAIARFDNWGENMDRKIESLRREIREARR